MGVSVKAEWIERYRSERERGEAERHTGRKIEHGLLAAYGVSLIGAAALIIMSL
jgi:hypothetical protein